jgi:hypothetical protein
MRRRRLLVVTRTERLLFHSVKAVRQRLKELPVFCGKAVRELGNLHLVLHQLLDGAGVFVVALKVFVPDPRASAHCFGLPTNEVDDFQLLLLRSSNLVRHLVDRA